MNSICAMMIPNKPKSTMELTSMFGFNKYQLGDVMRNNFHIPDPYLSGLDTYCIHHMSGEIFKRKLFEGTIFGIPDIENTYLVIYHNCNPYAVKRAKEIRVSFRKAKEEFGLDAFALVEIVDKGEG